MHYYHEPNLLLEALSYMGRVANGHTWKNLEERIALRGFHPSCEFTTALSLLKTVSARLDSLPFMEDPDILDHFKNMDGFPNNTIGTASPAFLIFYGLLEHYENNLEQLADAVTNMDSEAINYHVALALDLADDYPHGGIPFPVFTDMVLSLSIPDNSKLSILYVCRQFPSLFGKLISPVKALICQLEMHWPLLDQLCQYFRQKLEDGCENYLSRTSRLVPDPHTTYILRPFLFGMDTSLSSQCLNETTCIYSGILREDLLGMLSVQNSLPDTVYEIYHLLGDRTRFDLMCYLKDRTAYGQELSTVFGLSRNTIHHHMSKLSAAGLVRCTTNGNRVYYTLDKRMIQVLLEQQRTLFLGGPI